MREDVERFEEEWLQCRRQSQEKSIRQDRKKLAQAKKRLADLDKLERRVYEDYALGDLPKERYQRLSADYESERESLTNEIAHLENLIASQEEASDNYDRFMALVNKYVDIPEIAQAMVSEFIQKTSSTRHLIRTVIMSSTSRSFSTSLEKSTSRCLTIL